MNSPFFGGAAPVTKTAFLPRVFDHYLQGYRSFSIHRPFVFGSDCPHLLLQHFFHLSSVFDKGGNILHQALRFHGFSRANFLFRIYFVSMVNIDTCMFLRYNSSCAGQHMGS